MEVCALNMAYAYCEARTRVCECIYVCVCSWVYVCVCLRVDMCVCVGMYMCVCARAYIYICVCLWVYMCVGGVYMCVYIYIHTTMWVWVGVCVYVEEGKLVSEFTNSSETLPLVEEQAPFLNMFKSWKEQKYGHGFRNKKLTVLAKPATIYPTYRPKPVNRLSVGGRSRR
jgi:hypothetical protein